MRRKKRSITLLEIMIVIVIIGLIGGVLGYQMKGSLDEGKAFKSREGAAKLESLLNLQMTSQDWVLNRLISNSEGKYVDEKYLKDCLGSSGMIKDVDQFLKGGWGEPYLITLDEFNQISVTSPRLDAYEAAKKQQLNQANSTSKP